MNLHELRDADDYVSAADGCRERFSAAPDAASRAAVLIEWEELAYRMRQVGDDMPHVSVAEVPGALDAALAEGGLEDGSRAALLAGSARQRAWSQNPRLNIPFAREALAASESAGSGRTLAVARLALHMSLDVLDDAEERRRIADQMVSSARSGADDGARAMALWRRQIDRLLIADSAGYDYDVEALARSAEASGDLYWQTAATMATATRDLMHGNYERVDAALPELAQAAKAFPGLVTAALASLGMKSRAQRGRLTPGAGFGRVVTRVRTMHVAFRIAMAYSLCASGRATEAMAELGVVDFSQLPHDNGRVPSLGMVIEMGALHFHDSEMVRRAYELLSPACGTMSMTGDALSCWGPVDLYLGIGAGYLGLPEAREHLEAARRMAATMRARPWLARSLLLLGQSRLSGGDASGRGDAEEALQIAEQIGFVTVATEARAVLRPSAERPRTRSNAALSAREREVLSLMAAGLTAAEIGARLVLSTRTVEKHVERAYVKIGARNRSEGIAYAIANGLTAER